MTWPLPASFQTSCKRTALQPHKDHASRARSVGNDGVEEEDEEESNKTETTSKTLSSANTRSRTSTVHNQSERRRRERINQKMKALQKLVPNAHKTDKASMLEEVIDYLKQLQAQVEMMSHARSLVAAPQMMIPFDAHALHQQQEQQKQQQQQLQMSILAAAQSATMGVGLGMGMVHNFPFLHLPTTMPTSPPQFLHPQVSNSNGASSSVGPFDALAQSKSMELYMGNLAAIYQHQLHQLGSLVHGTHAINGASHSQQSYSYHNQGGR
ncbi:unnamed protein product [Linum tenue]|uniref:BHLH domain-containing protein n=1 Tax=Linum tenue TaxID=586396 RepID=A0AAV0LBU2_9ROSI|nr:unnamed protein product [Linum tenue]